MGFPKEYPEELYWLRLSPLQLQRVDKPRAICYYDASEYTNEHYLKGGGGLMDAKTDELLADLRARRKLAKARPAPLPPARFYTAGELAEALRLSPGTVRKLQRDGVIKALRFGPRTLRYDLRSVVEDLTLYETGGKA